MWEDLTTYVVFQRSDDPEINRRNESWPAASPRP